MDLGVKVSRGKWIGLMAGFLLFAFILWGINYSLGPDDLVLKLMLYFPAFLCLGIYLIVLLGNFNLRYKIEDDYFVLKWGLGQRKIIWEDIAQVKKVEGKANFFSLIAVSWPGYKAGYYIIKGIGAAKMFATDTEEGFILLVTNKATFGIKPQSLDAGDILAEKSGKELIQVKVEEIPLQQRGVDPEEDRLYSFLLKTNYAVMALYIIFMALFFPGSAAPDITILLVIFALVLFFFNISNANRLIHFSVIGGYFLLLLCFVVTTIFFVLSFMAVMG